MTNEAMTEKEERIPAGVWPVDSGDMSEEMRHQYPHQTDFENVDVPNISDPGQHYRMQYRGIKLDPFRICDIYGITSFGQATLVKKALRMGKAHKDRKQDLLDMRCCIDRMLEMMDEDDGGDFEKQR